MKVPRRMETLVRDGVIDRVVRPLMSGKEASVYLVEARGQRCCAKVYKDAEHRSFRQRADYQEGRKTRNSRRARAMEKGTRYGKRELEAGWHNAEVEALYRLAAAGVRVPRPLDFTDGVLLMELIADADGEPAARLNDVELSAETARDYHGRLVRDVVRMLCAGLVHGDLSEYNVLVDPQGPVIIDLPQAVDAAGNNSAPRMLLRDVENLAAYFGRFDPEIRRTDYGREIWDLFQKGTLDPETELTGRFKRREGPVDLRGVLSDIDDAREEHARRQPRAARPKPHRDETWRGVVPEAEPARSERREPGRDRRRDRPAPAPPPAPRPVEAAPAPAGARRVVDLKPPRPAPAADPPPAKKRRRRRRRKGPSAAAPQG